METFEINSLLRILRSSVKNVPDNQPANKYCGNLPNPAASTANFVASGQRFETLKSLRRQLRRHLAGDLGSSTSINYSLIQSIFDVLKLILTELVTAYFETHPQGKDF